MAIAQTETAQPYPTQTPYPTATPFPTPTATPQYQTLTWSQLTDFLLNDHTNWNSWTDQYTCVNFSLDLVAHAKLQRINAWIVGVEFAGQDEGHAFVAIPTSDRGIIWVEPQTDDTYTISQIGQPLCHANNPYLCWDGNISKIIQPASCDAKTHDCWQTPN
jgi:hypothetical protein